MAARPHPIDSTPAAFSEVMGRLRAIDDVLRLRVLPPGYEFETSVDGDLRVRRKADGAVAPLEFA